MIEQFHDTIHTSLVNNVERCALMDKRVKSDLFKTVTEMLGWR